jgi:phage gp16-like protein
MSRNALIGQVHAQARKLGLVDPAYRAILRGITGKASCKDMEDSELEAVLSELEALHDVRVLDPTEDNSPDTLRREFDL